MEGEHIFALCIVTYNLMFWYKEYVFIQPNGISTTLQRENHGNELLKS